MDSDTTVLSCDERNLSVVVQRCHVVEFAEGTAAGAEGTAAGAEGTAAGAGSAGVVLDCSGARIETGRVNAHTHIYSGLAPLGMPPPATKPESFVEILQQIWWRLDRALDENALHAAARLYCAEALLCGTTTLIDHHESPNMIEGSLDVIADAAEELGIRAVLCYGATERNGGRDEAKRGLAECRRFMENNRRLRIRGAVGLHASFTVSDETLRDAGALCEDLGAHLHVHLAEASSDVEDARRRGYPGPLERLAQCESLPSGALLAHGVHLDQEQVRRVGRRRCWLVQNPRSNRGNEVGYPRALASTERVALGTDGYPANMDDEEAALAEQATAHGDHGYAARGAAGRRLVSEQFGGSFAPLTVGAIADMAVMEQGRARHVLVGGKLVVKDGELQTGDIEIIRTTAREQAQRLWKRMAEL